MGNHLTNVHRLPRKAKRTLACPSHLWGSTSSNDPPLKHD